MSGELPPVPDYAGKILASVDPLPNAQWTARASAADAQQRVPDDAPFLAIWLKTMPDGQAPAWSKANMTFAALCQMKAVVDEMVARWARYAFEDAPSPTQPGDAA